MYDVHQQILESFRARGAAKTALTISSSLQKDVPALRLLTNILNISVDASDLLAHFGEKHLPDFVRATSAILIGSNFLSDSKNGDLDDDAVNMCDALRRNASFSLFAIVEHLPCCLPTAAKIMRSRHPKLLVAIRDAPDISIQRMLVRFTKLLYDHFSNSSEENEQFVADMDQFLIDMQDGASPKRAKLALSCFQSIDFDSPDEWNVVERFRKLLRSEVWDEESSASKCITMESCHVLLHQSRTPDSRDGFVKAQIDWNLRNISIRSEKINHNEPVYIPYSQMQKAKLTSDRSELTFDVNASPPWRAAAIKFSSASARDSFSNDILPRLESEKLMSPKVDKTAATADAPSSVKKSVAELRAPIRKDEILSFSDSEVEENVKEPSRSEKAAAEDENAFTGLDLDGVMLGTLTGQSSRSALPLPGQPTNDALDQNDSRHDSTRVKQLEMEMVAKAADSDFCGNTQDNIQGHTQGSPLVSPKTQERKRLCFSDEEKAESESQAKSAETAATTEKQKAKESNRSSKKRRAPKKYCEISGEDESDGGENSDADGAMIEDEDASAGEIDSEDEEVENNHSDSDDSEREMDAEMPFESEGESDLSEDLDADEDEDLDAEIGELDGDEVEGECEDEECDDADEGDSDREEEETLEKIGLILRSVLAKRRERSGRLQSKSRSAIVALEKKTSDAEKQAAVKLHSDASKIGEIQLGRITKVRKKFHVIAQSQKTTLTACRSSVGKLGKGISKKVPVQRKSVKAATEKMQQLQSELKTTVAVEMRSLKKKKAKLVSKFDATIAKMSSLIDTTV